MASLPGYFNVQAFTDGSVVAAGYRLYTYSAGTTTKKTAYTDAAGVTSHTYVSDGVGGEYIALNSRGELPAPLFLATGNYDLTLKTAAGAAVWTRRATGIADAAASLAESSGASLIGFITSGTGAVARTVQAALRDRVSAKDFGATGDGVTDDRAALQASQDAGRGPVFLPPGVYCVSGEVVIKDGAGFIGSGAFWKRRTGYVYDAAQQSIIKYTGAGGTNSCVIRASNPAVGTVGSDFSASGDGVTDDLTNITLRDFHIDANDLAEIGQYVYRAGNQSTLENVTAEAALKFCHVQLGCFAAQFGTFGAYECAEHGVACGWDIFGWASAECTNFAYSASFLTANNGTAGTYVAGTATDLDGSGGMFQVGRGSRVSITSEGNDGRACVLAQYNITGGTSGPTDYVLDYIEGNADGPYLLYKNSNDCIRLLNGFIHPGNGSTLLPQDITIRSAGDSGTIVSDGGPTDPGEWLTLYRLHGDLAGAGYSVDSNTTRYLMLECSPFVQFTDRRPGSRPILLELAGTSTAGTQTYTNRGGYCARYGNIVTVSGSIELSALDGATAGRLKIINLPYRAASLTPTYVAHASVGVWQNLTTSVIALEGRLSGGNDYIDLFKRTAAATSSQTDLLASDLTGTSILQFSITYITDAA